MTAHARARRGLAYSDPAEDTPHFSWRKSAASAREVFCEDVSLAEIARGFGTPVYVYSRQAITDAFSEIDAGLGRIPHLVCFAVKANGNLSLLKLLATRGSALALAQANTVLEIREALRYRAGRGNGRGILQFNVESPAELEVLIEESSRANSVPGVSIRVNPDVKAGGHPHIATGQQEHKFGVAWDEARKLYLAHRGAKAIRWQGISAHIGSQIVDLAPFRKALQRLASYVLDLRRQGIALKFLDVGGGLGVRYTRERPPSRAAYAKLIAGIARPLGVQVLLEPGRSIIAESCVLLSRVIYTKTNARKSFVILDAAMNDLQRPILYDAPHPITRVSQSGAGPGSAAKRVDIVGPVCETGDTFLVDWPLGSVSAGDLAAIWVAGAYGFAQSSNYNARTRAAEVLVNGKTAKLIRRRETYRDLLRTVVPG